jgi:hypothetical protein
LKELDYLTVIKPDAHRQWVLRRDLDILDRPTNDCFNLESKVGSPERIELDECVAELLSRRLADRSHLNHIEAIDGRVIGQVNYALVDELLRMRWNGDITYDSPCEQVPPPTPKLARINKGTDDKRSIERDVGRSFGLGALRGRSAFLQFTNTSIPLLVELAVMSQDHRKPDSCGDAERPLAVPGVVNLDEVCVYRLPLGRATAILGDDARQPAEDDVTLSWLFVPLIEVLRPHH